MNSNLICPPIEKNLPHGFDVYLVNQLICQNHEEDFFQILSASQKVRTLTNLALTRGHFMAF